MAVKCGYCSSENSVEDLRCQLCGRRLSGPVLVPDTYGNVAHRLDVLEDRLSTQDLRERQPFQARLFPVQDPKRVIPFESLSPDSAQTARATQQRNAKARNKMRVESNNLEDSEEIQREFSFSVEHLETRIVERALYIDAPVAGPTHRAMAAAYDMAMIAIGVGILITIYYFGGVELGLAKLDLGTYALVAICVALLYKVLWALSGGDTPGMAAVQLRLINFDGKRPNREERLLRVLVSIISFASLGVGLFWCLVDEEKLTWHDHITKTFSSPKFQD